LSEQASVELESGLTRGGVDATRDHSTVVSVGTRLNIGDYGSFYARWEGASVPRYSYSDPGGYAFSDSGGFQQAFSAGAGLGSMPAVIGTGAVGLAVAIFFATWDGS
jgi:hypothetical protein